MAIVLDKSINPSILG